MKHRTLPLATLAITAVLPPGDSRAAPIVTAPDTPPPVVMAAQELGATLKRIFPDETWSFANMPPATGNYIAVGSADSDPRIRGWASGRLEDPESFAVFVTADGPRRVGVIAGAGARGTAFGAAALLKKLGCDFYISGDALPAPRRGALPIDGWDLSDRPLFRERIVFNWHNFLSGCSTWNSPQWRAWIRGAQLGGFNAIMVHAYGNNPMAAFTFQGKEKPVGFLSTTIKGRDWSTPHVNDVRRLWGGEVFDAAVFGPDAGLVPDDQRISAVRGLMRDAFASAENRGMDVYFAVDVDTPTANPPELVESLPEPARFPIAFPATKDSKQPKRTTWLPNPDVPEGYAYWKAQVDALMDNYPQIDCLVAWFRAGGTPWTELKRGEMPPAWQREYEDEIAKTPQAQDLKWSHNQFAIAKIVRAFRRALDEGGHRDVRLATGSWRFDFVPAADRFMPPGVPLIPLDYQVLHEESQLRDTASRAIIRDAGAHRSIIPVTWAHHDDGHYLGRPYTPFDAFQSRLADARASGFGIIHWTTRPLDLYFESLSRQTWSSTCDEPLASTCAQMASRLFGPDSESLGGRYLNSWITTAPRFARETSDWVIDRRLPDIGGVIRGCTERTALLDGLESKSMTRDQRDRLAYFRGLEGFIAAFHETHDLYQRSRDALVNGDPAEARALMSRCHPEPVVQHFAEFSARGGITRGEQGLVVALNLRWLTHIIGHRQALGIEPVRVNFAPTQHDPLAQAAGRFTFHFDTGRRVWQCLGTEETGATTFQLPETSAPTPATDASVPAEICRTGIEITSPTKLTLQPLMALAQKNLGPAPRLLPGNYRLLLAFLPPTGTDPSTATVAINGNPTVTITLDPTKQPGILPIERVLPIAIGAEGRAELLIAPNAGTLRLCAATIESAAAASEGVTITSDGTTLRGRAPAYEAVIDNDGCLSSLRTGGAEFLQSAPRGIPRGFYLFQDGLVTCTSVTHKAADVIIGECEKAAIRYRFDPSTITIGLTNRTDKPLLLVGVFDSAVGAVLGDRGRFAKTPLNQNWKTTTWFRDRANVRITGGLRIWGPWSGNHQVWQTDVAPGQSAIVSFAPGVATEEQIAKASQTANSPPPAPPADPVGPMWDMARFSKPPRTWPAEGFQGEGVRAVFFEGPLYEGQPTRVFAWIGLPKIEPGQKVPGMVLVHGGGGTAFDSWVRRWTSRGYAAIAMDTCGCVPKGAYGRWEAHPAGGPPGWGGYNQIDDPREDQWAFHAVADAILAHSLLRSLPDVDAQRTGLTGISWGGYLTCLIASVDHRFKLAVPVYGCGFTSEHGFAGSVNALGPERAARWMRWWDPSSYLKDAAMPMLWVTGTNDFAYTLNALQKSYRLPKGPHILCVRLRMRHGHGDAGEAPKEIFTFADSILKNKEPLAKITGQNRDGRHVTVMFESAGPITKAELMVTRASGRWQDRLWEILPAQLDPAGKVSATLPENATVYYVNLFDDRDCVVSTEHEELTTTTAATMP